MENLQRSSLKNEEVNVCEPRAVTFQRDIIAVALLIIVVVLVWGMLKYWLLVRSEVPSDYRLST